MFDPRQDHTSTRGFDWPPPAPIRVGQDDVHVWHVDLDASCSQGSVDFEILSDDERVRSGRFKFARDRHRFVVGRTALRRILSAYIGLAASDIRFIYGEFGKPALAPDPQYAVDTLNSFSFNCSNSGEMFACAISGSKPIGVDIEQIRPIDDLVGLARAHFSPAEVDALQAVVPGQQRLAFFNGWTRKEAYIKATGNGLSQDLDSFSVSLSPGQEPRLLSCADAPSHTENFSIYALTTIPGYVGAIAAKGTNHTLSFWRFPDR